MDDYHNIVFPKNGTSVTDKNNQNNIYDMEGDHIYTNLVDLYQKIIQRGYYVLVVVEPLDCIDLKQYGTLMIVDPERKFSVNEIKYISYMT